METYYLKDDIKLLCVNASSFPDGIMDAHEKLKGLLPSTSGRKFYGISFPDKTGKINYKAGVEESFKDEGDKLKLETFVVKRGEYTGSRILNYIDHIESIDKTFQKILKDPRIDSNGCCC
ncbi:MAG: transcriptional regulator [Cyclobacteriaceae bacterium]